MIVYRLTKSYYAKDLSGKGAEMAGGRWNSKGTQVIYTSESRALCLVEVAVHIPLGTLPKDYVIISMNVPESSIRIMDNTTLPPDWKSNPPSFTTRKMGDQFIAEGKFLLFKVPSAVVQDEYNYLINPKHTDISKVEILSVEPFLFDSRFFK